MFEIDLSTRYLGLTLRNPLIVSSCPLTGELDVLRRLEDLGAAAAVMPSLFEEQLEQSDPAEELKSYAAAESGESLPYYRELATYNRGPESYLRHIDDARHAVSIPIIGSLNATTPGTWLDFARRIEDAGADALELNVCLMVTSRTTTSEEVEARYTELVAEVRRRINIPLAVKLSPYLTAIPHLAARLVSAGANGLVLFNRLLHPDVELATMRVVPKVALSTSHELPTRLRWLAILHGRVNASLAATGGVHTGEDVIKSLLVGADAVMFASALYRNGIEHMSSFLPVLTDWLKANEYASVEQAKGELSHMRSRDPAAFERANYAKAISSFAES
jgi:dihydroorotate dehydrogenase (fumarate)